MRAARPTRTGSAPGAHSLALPAGAPPNPLVVRAASCAAMCAWVALIRHLLEVRAEAAVSALLAAGEQRSLTRLKQEKPRLRSLPRAVEVSARHPGTGPRGPIARRHRAPNEASSAIQASPPERGAALRVAAQRVAAQREELG